MRIILYTGKGGVGKTSIAAATAIKLADEGKRVMIISTDQAHSLADSLDVKLGSETTKILSNLDALEIDVVAESESAWGNLRTYMKEILTSKVESGIEAEELLVFPGLEELFALFKILDIYEKSDYDILIVDCAPTGETLSLLKYPDLFGEMLEKLLPVKRKMVKVAGPIVQTVTKVPMPKDNVFEDIERLMDKLERLQTLMLDKTIVSLRIVTTPEKIVIKETKRNFTWLQLFDYNVDAIIINKVYPKIALEGYFNQWVKLQEEGLLELEESFRDVPRFMVMLQKHELKTIPVLKAVSTFYGEVDPSGILAVHKTFSIIQRENRHFMEIYLPFAEKSEMDLGQNNGEIQIAVKNEKRCFALPDVVKGKAIESAKFENGTLTIAFAQS
ncbi:ArsA family ATPase [Fusibacter ferrireducens]|uniref:ArsA family ATPase n=1 Tax=Fusibacter ferrireducens TaxID=2785058 RepID=A0ABR9ZYN2_9FIRM|nr:ArsA family ATPase [Fusibacter ferrireducens]MBF4695577.1 ArsA family ATPase [Fusibacter ferrireducens]